VKEEDRGSEDRRSPSKVFGYGFIREDGMRYEFAFNASGGRQPAGILAVLGEVLI
jgi:hypothetical protein